MKRRTMAIVTGCALMLAGQPAWAARTGAHEAAESPEYGRKFGGMIGRGVINAATCFVDVLVNVVNETKAGPPLVGTVTGAAKGLVCGTLRLGSGAVDVLTFWVPGFNGFPVSDSYDDCLAASRSSARRSSESQEATTSPESPQTTATWDVPTAEPGAAQAPAQAPSSPRSWKK